MILLVKYLIRLIYNLNLNIILLMNKNMIPLILIIDIIDKIFSTLDQIYDTLNLTIS